jgi:hypothetical protein
MIKRVLGNVGASVVLFGAAWGCTMAQDGDYASTDQKMVVPGPIIYNAPVVAPPMGLTNAGVSCDLAEYFPDADGAAGGWTTGTCNGATYSANVSWYPPSVCSLDEMFDNWEGPNVPYLGTHCRALMAGSWQRRSIYYRPAFVPSTSPPSRGMLARTDGPPPYNNNQCRCIYFDDGRPPICGVYGYEYVVCPWTATDNLDAQVTANKTIELNQHVVGYCNSGTTALGAQGSGTYGVVYAVDPKCPNCVPCP